MINWKNLRFKPTAYPQTAKGHNSAEKFGALHHWVNHGPQCEESRNHNTMPYISIDVYYIKANLLYSYEIKGTVCYNPSARTWSHYLHLYYTTITTVSTEHKN